MKELSIQEKAKRYDEALETARRINSGEGVDASPDWTTCEVIFPELKDRISKEIINYIKNSTCQVDNETYKSWISWLEKQGEQKVPVNDFKAKDWYVSKVDGKIHNIYHSGDKVEPKFKIGDWIVNNINDHSREILHIYDIRGDRYYFNGNIPLSWCIKECDEKSHLWTIQDAKDGDVLAFDDNTIVIFKDLYNSTTFHSYCHIEDGIFSISKDNMPDWWEGKGFVPATKEQCDLLFAKMEEAGYKWDAENLKLSKAEPMDNINAKPASFYMKPTQIPKFRIGDVIRHKTGLCPAFKIDRIVDMHYIGVNDESVNIAVQDNWELVEQVPAEWSEEDEDYINDLIKYFSQNERLKNTKEDIVIWLKSLRPQNTWKPSDEQMAALSDINCTGCISYAGQEQELINLYNDLNKLKCCDYGNEI